MLELGTVCNSEVCGTVVFPPSEVRICGRVAEESASCQPKGSDLKARDARITGHVSRYVAEQTELWRFAMKLLRA